MKKYNVTIEQPCIRSYEIEAVDIDEAMALATELYESTKQVFREDEFGTDAQIQASAEDDSESTEWTDL